ncbi:MAG: hypothetical protein ACK5M4_03750 [Pseudorhodobacter sp.]
MTNILLGTTLVALFLPMMAIAGPVEKACLKSDRQASSRALCGCIQQVADMTLTSADQRRAANFFNDPDQAQKVRMSKSDRDNDFWTRYRSFGEMAESYCAG